MCRETNLWLATHANLFLTDILALGNFLQNVIRKSRREPSPRYAAFIWWDGDQSKLSEVVLVGCQSRAIPRI
jgi:hypothetical protein